MNEAASSAAAKAKAAISDNAAHVLVVDDDQRIRELLLKVLQANGFRVSGAANVAAARSAMSGIAFDVIVLDLMMDGESPLSFASELKANSHIPILMLTARADPDDRIKGLEAGVDDYLGKPFDPRELLLRLHNVLRRRESRDLPRDEIRMGDFTFHVGRGELKRGERSVKLTERERELMRLFASRPGTTIPRHELIAGEATGSERAVDVQINRLRRKIEADPSNPVYLQTVRGRGYMLHAE